MENSQIKQLLTSLADTFAQNSTIKKIYGEPIETQGKTIIPVAKVSLGFGGGFGSGGEKKDIPSSENNTPEANGEGGGFGGGLSAKPIGIIEVTSHQTRFIRFDVSRYIVLGALLGLAISMLSKRAWRHRKNPVL